MTRAWDKEKFWVPDRNRTHDLPNTGRALYPLIMSYENSWRARSFNWVHIWQVSCILLGSTLSRSSWVVIINNYRRLTNDLSMTETKPTNGLLTDRLNNTRTKNRPIWLTIDASKPTNDWWQTSHESFSQYHHGYTDQSRSTDQTYNIIDWQTLFTWLWRWLPLRLSKRQSPTTVLFRTTLTRTITLYERSNKQL